VIKHLPSRHKALSSIPSSADGEEKMKRGGGKGGGKGEEGEEKKKRINFYQSNANILVSPVLRNG
jgi:hypothetical protein